MTAKEKTSNGPRIDIAVAVSCECWHAFDFDPEALACDIARLAFAMADVPAAIQNADLEFSIVLADDTTIQTLNRDYRGKDTPTNVLSFAALDAEEETFTAPADEPWPVGDVILAYETIEKEALEQNKSLRSHLAHLVAHGTLHLLGYDHEDSHEAEVMESLEVKILKKYGIDDPYSDRKTVA